METQEDSGPVVVRIASRTDAITAFYTYGDRLIGFQCDPDDFKKICLCRESQYEMQIRKGELFFFGLPITVAVHSSRPIPVGDTHMKVRQFLKPMGEL